MDAHSARLEGDSLKDYLSVLLGDATSVQDPPTTPWQSRNQPSRCSMTGASNQQDAQGQADQCMAHCGPKATLGAFEATTHGKRAGSSRSNNVVATGGKGNRGIRRQVQQLEEHLTEQQHRHQEQIRRKVYLTERINILEKLIAVHVNNEATVKRIQAGLNYNPFTAYNATVEEFISAKPSWLVERYQHVAQSHARRLMTCASLLEVYPHLVTYRPPAELLDQLLKELSLAESTNPYGADGLPVGSLTVAVPQAIVTRLAAAYGLDMSHLNQNEQTILSSFAALVLEQHCLDSTCRHAYFMMPRLCFSNEVHVHAASNATWEDLTACLSSIQVESDMQDSAAPLAFAGTTIANEAHWHSVAANLGLSIRQKLQTQMLWDITSRARSIIQSQRAQLTAQMIQLWKIESKQQNLQTTAASKQPGATGLCSQNAACGDQAHDGRQRQTQQGKQSDRAADPPCSRLMDCAAACYRLSPEQLTLREVLMRQLKDTLTKERHLMVLAGVTLFQNILSPINTARANVHSHPFFPAQFAILEACAAECTPTVMDALVVETERGRSM